LSSNQNYSLEECLAICRKLRITDAEAFLLEQTGDIPGALSLTLKTLESRMDVLKRKLRRYPTPERGRDQRG
jgi:hypothetical protein